MSMPEGRDWTADPNWDTAKKSWKVKLSREEKLKWAEFFYENPDAACAECPHCTDGSPVQTVEQHLEGLRMLASVSPCLLHPDCPLPDGHRVVAISDHVREQQRRTIEGYKQPPSNLYP